VTLTPAEVAMATPPANNIESHRREPRRRRALRSGSRQPRPFIPAP
jgi:hypothetical protein